MSAFLSPSVQTSSFLCTKSCLYEGMRTDFITVSGGHCWKLWLWEIWSLSALCCVNCYDGGNLEMTKNQEKLQLNFLLVSPREQSSGAENAVRVKVLFPSMAYL